MPATSPIQRTRSGCVFLVALHTGPESPCYLAESLAFAAAEACRTDPGRLAAAQGHDLLVVRCIARCIARGFERHDRRGERGAGEAGACGSISAGSADREPDPAPLAASSPGTIAASEAGAATGTNVSSLQRPNPRKPFTLLSRSTIGTPDIDTMRPCPLPPTGQTRSTPVNVEPAASASEKRSSVSSTPRASSAGGRRPGQWSVRRQPRLQVQRLEQQSCHARRPATRSARSGAASAGAQGFDRQFFAGAGAAAA